MKKERVESRMKHEPVGLSDPLAQTILNSLSAHIAILDEKGVILETNRTWRSQALAISADQLDYIKAELKTGERQRYHSRCLSFRCVNA